MFLDDLPIEIQQRILSLIPLSALGNVAQTSKKLELLTKDEFIWRGKVKTQLTATPLLLSGQSYKDYYRDIYRGIYRDIRYGSAHFGNYLKEIEKNEISPRSLAVYLYFSCRIGAEIWISELIQKGGVLKISHLENVCESGNIEGFELVLKHMNDIELNIQLEDYSGSHFQPTYKRSLTIFHKIALMDNSDVYLKRLFSEKSRITVLPELHVFAARGDTKELIQLIAGGYPIEKKDIGECSALWWAIVCGQEECARVLISHNVDLTSIAVGENRSALMVAIWRKQIGLLKLIVEKNINLNEKIIEDAFHPIPLTALHKAAQNNFVEGLELFLKKGLRVNQYSFSPLHVAAKNGHKDSVALLLKHGAPVNLKGKWIDEDEDYKDDIITIATPLGLAADNGHMECIKLLLLAGANPNMEEEEQIIHKGMPLEPRKFFALGKFITYLTKLPRKYHQSDNITIELNKDNFDVNLPEFSCSKNYLDTLELFLKKSDNINQSDFDGYTILMCLINSSYSFAPKLKNYEKLLEAAVSLLLTYKIKVNALNRHNQSALHIAVKKRRINLVRKLVEQGSAACSIPDKDGDTPFILAARWGDTEIVKYLFEHGAMLNEKNNKGETALMCAEIGRHQGTLEFLKSIEHSNENSESLQFSPNFSK